MKYYIYYIPGVKVGCTNNLKKRVENEQGYTEDQYKVLFTTSSIELAAKKEKFFQETLGYKVDPSDYKSLMIKRQNMKIKVAVGTVTFGNSKTVITKDALLAAGRITDPSKKYLDYDIVITDKVADFILQNLKESQFTNAGKFVYLAKLKNKFSVEIVEDEPQQESRFDLIRAWAGERGIYTDGDAKTQLVKLMEEVGETSKAILKDDRPEIKDGIGDCVVVLTNLAHLCGLTIEECIDAAYNEIKDRKGEMKNQTFVKQ